MKVASTSNKKHCIHIATAESSSFHRFFREKKGVRCGCCSGISTHFVLDWNTRNTCRKSIVLQEDRDACSICKIVQMLSMTKRAFEALSALSSNWPFRNFSSNFADWWGMPAIFITGLPQLDQNDPEHLKGLLL
jgi:hypothetical protein